MPPTGSPDIVERGKATQFKSGGRAAKEAGKKSGKKRREQRTMRETMKILAATPMGPGKAYDLARLKNMGEVSDDKNLTPLDIVTLKIVQGALEDDPECRRLFLELTDSMKEPQAAVGVTAEDDELSQSLRELGEVLESDD